MNLHSVVISRNASADRSRWLVRAPAAVPRCSRHLDEDTLLWIPTFLGYPLIVMRSPRSNAVSLLVGLARCLPYTSGHLESAEAYTLSTREFRNVVDSLDAPEIEPVVGKGRAESFFPLASQLWPTMPPGR
jgi:hypothetical protein